MQRRKKLDPIEFKLDKVNLIKEISRERIGSVPASKVIKDKTLRKKLKYRVDFTDYEDIQD